MYHVDVVIPFCAADSHLVQEAIQSILVQIGIRPLIHVVADNCPFPSLLPTKDCIRYYSTNTTTGPGRITNAIAAHHVETPYLALQDADDLSYPERLLKQLNKIQEGYDQVSSSMQQIAMPGYKGTRHLEAPILYCGGKFGNVPKGRLINGTRMVTLEMFKSFNGFCDLMCSQDLAFDNVTAFLNVPTYCFVGPLATRRLHPDSMTNGPNYTRDPGSGGNEILRRQKELLKQIKTNPTMETARSQGCLDKAEPLCTVASIYSTINA